MLMVALFDLYQQPFTVLLALLIAGLWTLAWEGVALWHAARNRQKKWFIALLLLNTLGLLPIIYLIWFRAEAKKAAEVNSNQGSVRRKASKKRA